MPTGKAPDQIEVKSLDDYLEVMSKAVFQSGMSWKVVEAKWSTTREAFHDFDEETQKVISRVQVEESRTIDNETSPIELAQRYILLFWKRTLEQEQKQLVQRVDISNENRFKESTRMRHDLHLLAQGWGNALPMIEARLHVES